MTKSDLSEFFNSLTLSEQLELDSLLSSVTAAWAPLPGPQTLAYHSPADFLFYGGAAGGGKTDLLLGLALVHYRALIFRRVFPSLRAIIERSRALYQRDGTDAKRDSFNESRFCWRFKDGRTIRFGSIQHEKNVLDWQGQPHDFYGFDEITEFTEYMVRYVTAWNRPLRQDVKVRCRIVGTGNPPTTKDGEWVLDFFGPWLRDDHPNPAVLGELRYFSNIDGKDVEVDSPEPFMRKGELIVPKSRTFIPASIEDNPYLIQAGYKAQLQALPEPLRSKLLYGDFKAGIKEDSWQLIPSAWVKAAQARWKERPVPPEPVNQVGADIARGGNDRLVLSPRTGNYFHEQHIHPGVTVEDGNKAATLIVQLRTPLNPTGKPLNIQPGTIVAIDAIGVGSSPYDILKAGGFAVMKLIASEASDARDKTGMFGFYNKRSEWMWKFREALDPESGLDLALPNDKELLIDLCAAKFELTARGIKVESKDEIKARLLRSPDKGDSMVYAYAVSTMPGQGLFDYMKKQYAEHKQKEEEEERRKKGE